MNRLSVQTLGGFAATFRRSGECVTLPTRKAIAVTAYLAVRRRERVGREEIAELLWGGVLPAQSRHSLRQTVLEIRHALGPEPNRLLITTADAVGLEPRSVHVDVHAFERCLARRTPHSIAMACALYRGEFLAGLHVREPAFDVWVTNERNRLNQLAIDAHQQRVMFLMEQGLAAAALQLALRIIDLDPFHEWAHRAVMTLYAERGQLSAARFHYRSFAERLREELDVDPETETQELLNQLLRARGTRAPLRQRPEG